MKNIIDKTKQLGREFIGDPFGVLFGIAWWVFMAGLGLYLLRLATAFALQVSGLFILIN